MSGDIRKLLIIPHLKVHNANALSSPFTIGFPAMTAWLGAVHALQRKLNQNGFPVTFSATGVVSHQVNLQTYKGENDFVYSIVGTGNPLDKSGERSSFIEEARCHLDVSLVIEYEEVQEEEEAFLSMLSHLLHANMKIAGGDIQSFSAPYFLLYQENDETDKKRLQRALTPGYVLIERRQLMADLMAEGVDALDALIDYLAIHYTCEVTEENGTQSVNWRTHRKQINGNPAGWLIPIATGFQGISPLAEAKNQRDSDVSHRFAESLVTLGEFKMPHRICDLDEMFWHSTVDGDMYLCYQNSHKALLATQPTDDEDDYEF